MSMYLLNAYTKYTYIIYTGNDRVSAMCMRVTVLLSYNVWLKYQRPSAIS
jgi:hypothetical protein